METVLKFDKVILIKELNEKVKKVGDTFEIANILDGSFLLREARTRVAVGVINFEDFEEHFVKEEDFKCGWTPWTPLTGIHGQTDALYRTNRKKVQVKFLTDKVRAEASCHKMDEFNLFFGVQMAYMRCRNKAMLKRKELLLNNMEVIENTLKAIDSDIADNNKTMKKMIKSIEA